MKKKFIIIISTICFVCLLAMGLVFTKDSSTANPTISRISADVSIDPSDKKKVVGFADHVFVAKVIDENGPIYKHKTKSAIRSYSIPYTSYSVKTLKTIKGNLKKDKIFDMNKFGGLTEDGKKILLFDDDELLKKDSYYLIIASTQPDGSILASGPLTSIKLNITSEKDIESNKVYKEYFEAKNNEVIYDRLRY